MGGGERGGEVAEHLCSTQPLLQAVAVHKAHGAGAPAGGDQGLRGLPLVADPAEGGGRVSGGRERSSLAAGGGLEGTGEQHSADYG